MLSNRSGLNLSFEEEGHKYAVDNIPYSSVTSMTEEITHRFDAESVSKELCNSSPKYLHMTPDEIKLDWAERTLYGIAVHHNIERYLLGESVSDIGDSSPEFAYFLSFIEDFKVKLPQYPIFIPEQRVFDPERKIAGTIDMIAMNNDKLAILVDWKTCRKISTESKKKCKEPFREYDDCNLNRYKFQLNYYRSILERYYGVRVVMMMIVVLNAINEKYVVYDVERIRRI